MTPPNAADRAIKRARVLAILDAKNATSILLTSQPALSWYLDGSRVHGGIAADPIVGLRVGRDGDELFVTSNE